MKKSSWLFFIICMFIGYVLDIIPVPDVINWLRPTWTFLFLSALVAALPDRYGMGIAFLMGLLLDLLNGSLLGEHALAMTVAIYCLTKLHRSLVTASYLQQMLMMAVLVFIYKLVIYWVQVIIHSSPGNILYWGSIVTSAILWPWISFLLNDMLRRYRIG